MVHFYYDIDVWELYDLEKDPNELNNVYGNPEYADIRAGLHARIKELQTEVGDNGTLEDFRYVTSYNFRKTSREK
jgi:hypothetical protein